MKQCIYHSTNYICKLPESQRPDFCDEMCEEYKPLSSHAVLDEVGELIKAIDHFNDVIRGKDEAEKHFAFSNILFITEKVRANLA